MALGGLGAAKVRSWGGLGPVLGPLGSILGRLGAILGGLGCVLGQSWGGLGHLGPVLGRLGELKTLIFLMFFICFCKINV